MAVTVKRTKSQAFWLDQIQTYEKEFQKWESRSKKIVKRYKDERNDAENSRARFNILWSNVQTLQPALYAKNPVPNVDRRFEDEDVVGTTAARVLERAVTYFVDDEVFGSVMSQCVLDRLLSGRGVAWVRYDLDENGKLTDDVKADDENYTEDVKIDYVHWQDFGHTWARTWEETRGVWRIVYMGRDELVKRFKNGKSIPLNSGESTEDEDKIGQDKAMIYEIWDKKTKKAIWLHKSMEDVLDERPDPLGLHDFFPCPKPIYATLGNDNLIPSPDYAQYQDQAKELDDLTGRIDALNKALKVVGVYDKSAEGVSRILSEGLDNTMVPVEQWAIFGEKGGLKGVVDWFPVEMVANVLVQLYEMREKVKTDLYEITGLADIIRGSSDPTETATAQQIKGQFATIRLDAMQKDVARFARDLVRLVAEIIAEHFSIETIKQICGIRLMTAQEKAMAQQQLQMPGPDGQPQQPPEELVEALENPTWEEVEQLLRDDLLRCFRISIETDSTIKADQEAEKTQRVELVQAVGTFLEQAAALPPQLMPLAAELLMFGVRGFKVSREIETTFEMALKKIKQAAEQPPPPDPEMQKMQMEMEMEKQKHGMEQEREQQKLQVEQQKAQQQLQLEQAKMQMEGQKMAMDMQYKQAEYGLKEKELQFKGQDAQMSHEIAREKIRSDDYKARMDAKSKVSPDVAMSDPDMNGGEIAPVMQMMAQLVQTMQQGFTEMLRLQAQENKAIIQAVMQPRHTEVIRDQDGKIKGGVSMITNQTVQ